jgi:hypothetical protein
MPREYVKSGGVWVPVNNLYVRNSGSWSPVKVGYIKNAGAWNPVFSGIVVTLASGTEYQSSAVYTSNLGASAYWFRIDISGNVTSLGQATNMAWPAGYKLFASVDSTPSIRSNLVGEYALSYDYTGSVGSYAIPATIPGQYGNVAPTSVLSEMWGGGSSGRGGYTLVNLGTTTGTVYFAVASQGVWNNGFTGIQRFQWDRYGCGSQDQVSSGWTGLFKVHPYNGTTNYRDPSVIPSDSNIWGVAGGMSSEGNAGGGSTGAGTRPGTQSAPGSFYIIQVNNQCYNTCSGIGVSEAVFVTCPSKLIGSWIASGFETCTYGTGGGGYYPGGSWTNGPCSSVGGGGGSGFVGPSAGSGSVTAQGTGSNQSNSPYYTGNSRLSLRIR